MVQVYNRLYRMLSMKIEKKQIRDIIRLGNSIIFFWLYIPHLFIMLLNKTKREYVFSDAQRQKTKISITVTSNYLLFLYLLHNNRYFRSVFYYRIGAINSLLFGWWRPGDKYFQISFNTKVGKGFKVVHPYATVINAKSIGDNFSCLHCTTLGAKGDKKPIVGNNVSLGAHVLIIGGVSIGNNVIVGAGAVVVKDLPDNCVAVGNPAKPIKFIETK